MPAPFDDATLEREARVFSRYLVDREPPPPFVLRYREANRALLEAPGPGPDAALLAFALRHPWSVPWLDAACGWLRPGGLLRNKILVMAAILEASPEFAEDFLPRDTGAATLVLRLAGLGLLGALRTLGGLLLYPVAVRS